MTKNSTLASPQDDLGPDVLPQWATDNLEFFDRALAVQAMIANRKLRQHVLRAMSDLQGVGARMAGHDCAAECLSAVWVERHRSFRKSWNSVLPGPVFAHCLGAIRNRYHNAVERATGRWEGRSAHDVRYTAIRIEAP